VAKRLIALPWVALDREIYSQKIRVSVAGLCPWPPKGLFASLALRSGAVDERPELVPVAALLGPVNALLHLGDLVVEFADHRLEPGLTT